MDWSKFDKQVDLDALKQDVQDASNNKGTFEELPDGTYAVKINKMELKTSKKGDPMVSIWFKVTEGKNQNRLIFYNRLVNQPVGIHMANELLRSLESGLDVKFDSYAQYNDLLLDMSEEIEGSGLTYDLEVKTNNKGFRDYTILEVYELIFFDFEVYPRDWVVVLANACTRSTTEIVNSRDQLEAYYSQHKQDIWVGYNCREYDQYILKAILLDMNPFDVSHAIINEEKRGWEISREFNQIPLVFFDVMTDKFKGLKQLEGFMGHNIEETTVPFNENRKLTDSEIQDVLRYCRHDVEQTIEVFLNRQEEFDSQMALIKTFSLPIGFLSKTKPQLAAIILGAVRSRHDDEFQITIPDELRLDTYAEIRKWYQDKHNHFYDLSLTTSVSGVKHVFAWGGLHGANECVCESGIILSIDVASYYPALMIEYGFASRNITNPQKYRQIRDERIQLKAAKDPMQLPYKIVLNSTYGAMKDKFNALYDPLMANNVCVNGQLFLLDLIEKLEPHWQLIQSNTDGLVGKATGDVSVIHDVCREWESRTRMVLEFETYAKIVQKDVNNYILIREDGSFKSKGSYVKKLDVLDNDLPIVNRAVVECLVHDIPVEVTIRSCQNLMEFQKVVKLSGKYTHFRHGNKPLREKTLRIFASSDLMDPGIYKVKTENRIEKVAGSPGNCFIDNGNVNGKPVPEKLDRDWYIRQARDRVNDFLGDLEFLSLL